ncbi:Mothers against decapentaplegic [Paragonimus heterotremus]|uniref:Mothers against decapentaplegic n=1 Tax=Paragonimus heterotremus TaxID=100268 RepID=A0A8J4SP80_9TREM|nr:Mothers against decapentaplegic [Paragonimus heterotremus]
MSVLLNMGNSTRTSQRLPVCRASSDDLPGRLCINPKHWSRVIFRDHSDSESLSGGTVTSESSFEGEPDLFCVGISATQRTTNSLFSLNESVLGTQNRENSNMQSVRRNVPSLRSDHANIPRVLNPVDQFNLLAAKDKYFYSLKDVGSELTNVDTAGNSSNVISFSIPQIDPTCQSTFNNTGCHTTCTELTDSSLNSAHIISSDSPMYQSLPASSSVSSSASTSEIDEQGLRTTAERVSFLKFIKPDVAPMNPKTRSWASLSYWEANRHVAHSWFKLSDPVAQVVYDNKLHYSSSEAKNTGTRRCSQNVHRSRGITYVCLSSLFAQPDNQLHSESIDQFELSYTSCTTSSSASGSPTTKHNDFSPICIVSGQQCTHSFRLNSTPPSLSERKVSWRQCYRLGSHGLILTLTPGGRVWLDNKTTLSDLPIFVSSACLSGKHNTSTGWPVYRVPAGYSILIFDQLIYQQNQFKSQASHTLTHVPVKLDDLDCQPNSCNLHHFPVVHISLGKGWGPSYHRPDITHCPARLELWINIHNLSKYARQ